MVLRLARQAKATASFTPVPSVTALAVVLVWTAAAQAQTAASTSSGDPGLFDPARTNLLGDMGGLRTALGKLGMTFGLSEQDEVWDNVTGGIHRGAAYDGLTTMNLGLDTEKAFGWAGGTFDISALQIHGRSISADNLDVLDPVSSIEDEPSTRLWELWYQQSLFGGLADVKIGQQAFDQEFMISQYGSLFLNSNLGSPSLTATDLYAGGPQYPLSSLGVRMRAHLTPKLTVLAGVFDDNPPGGPFSNDSPLRGAEASGTAFNLNTGALWMTEAQYTAGIPTSVVDSSGKRVAETLPGDYKLGFWYDSGSFPDQRYDAQGLSLANTASSGVPRMHHGNYGLYAVMDQAVWQPDPKGAKLLGVFAEVSAVPPDRNEVSFSATAGVTLADPLPGRLSDTVGLGFGVTKISGTLAALDEELGAPVQTDENFIEATYAAQIAPWWLLQPDIQYIIHPSGGVPDPTRPGHIIGNELVFGLHSSVTF
jgi:porin